MTGLQELEDALPDAGEDENRQKSDSTNVKIKHKSLKSRPGAGKKKERLITMEMERFKKNMALMATGTTEIDNGDTMGSEMSQDESGETKRVGGIAERWAAIRSFISQTMERRPEGGRVEEKG